MANLDLTYMALAALVALFGSWTALDLTRRVNANIGQARIAWMTGAALALGLAIWAMHMIALLAKQSGRAAAFDGPVMLMSLSVAVAGCGFGVWLTTRIRNLAFALMGGAVIGLIIAVSQFVGMDGFSSLQVTGYRPTWAVLAIGLGVVCGAGALVITELAKGAARRVLASLVLTIGMLACHRASVTAFPLQPSGVSAPGALGAFEMAMAVAGGVVFIFFLAGVAALFDRRFEGLAAIEAERNAAQLRSILEQTPVGIVVADAPSGEISFANPEAEFLMGHPIVDTNQSRDALPYGPVDEQGRRRGSDSQPLMRAVRRGYRTDRLVQRYRRPDGSIVIFEVAAAPIRDADGRIVQAVATFHDITAKMKAEEALRQSQRMEGIGQLTGGVAHDFNNVLTAVLGSLQLAAKRVTDERARQLMDNAVQAAERGAKLTSQLLAFSRRQRLEPLPVDLNAMIERMGGLFASTLGGTVKVERVLAAGLPAALADPAQLELALLNLALNARDAMPQGGVLGLSTALANLGAPKASSEPESGRYIALSVKDTGPGMSDEVAERAFEPFFTTKAVGKGSGLGLSQVLGLAKQLGGGVRLETKAGKGVEVTLYLPVSPQTTAAVSLDLQAEPPRARDGARVLVVDDDEDVRRFVVDFLEDSGYVVAEAKDGPSGLRMLEDSGPFDLVLLDFAMPGMTGSEVARTVRAQTPAQPILMMTGYLEHEAVLTELGAQPMLQKPFDPSELLFRVAALIET